MVIKNNCLICGKECKTKYTKYCSIECYKSKPRKIKNIDIKLCNFCNKKETETRASKYCSDCSSFVWENERRVHNIGARRRALRYYNIHKNDLHMREYKKKYMREYQRKKSKESNDYRIQFRLRNYVNSSLKRYSSKGKIMSCYKYGIDLKSIIEHLKPFPENLSEYHIDHIIPLSSFNLNNPLQVKMAFSPDNLQWLKSSDNISKSNKIIPNTVGFKQLFDNY